MIDEKKERGACAPGGKERKNDTNGVRELTLTVRATRRKNSIAQKRTREGLDQKGANFSGRTAKRTRTKDCGKNPDDPTKLWVRGREKRKGLPWGGRKGKKVAPKQTKATWQPELRKKQDKKGRF